MHGFNVLMPMGFDAFGLPAENAAIERGIHPHTWTMDNIERMDAPDQDDGRHVRLVQELATCLPEYYKWNQWFFLKFFEQGLAYRAKAPVNWCPKDQGVLANEQVVDGRCWRCDTPVIRRDLEQWFFKITDVRRRAARLLADRVARARRDDAAELDRPLRGRRVRHPGRRTAPSEDLGLHHPHRHRLRHHLGRAGARAPAGRRADHARAARGGRGLPGAGAPPERDRAAVDREGEDRRPAGHATRSTRSTARACRSGSPTTCWAPTAPAPSWACPASDERDFEFAKKFGLPIIPVVVPEGWDGSELAEAYVEPGVMVNSGQFDGLPSRRARSRSPSGSRQQGIGQRTVNYRLRDWLISRQRYWGTPIPMVYCEGACGIVPVPEDGPAGRCCRRTPSSSRPASRRWPRTRRFINATCPTCGGPARRETDTMDTFMDSSWYFLRYADPHFDQPPGFDTEKARLLDAGRPVHGRRRARRHAPAVLALLHAGAARPRAGRGLASRSSGCSTRARSWGRTASG